MTSGFSYFTGIDVSKDKVDIFSTEKGSHLTVRNSKKQIREALYHFDREHTLIVLENTGGYENVCVDTLQRIGYSIHRANNNRVKSFVRYRGIKGKTDKIDAEALADYGQFTYNNQKKFVVDEEVSEVQKKVKETTFLMFNLKKVRGSMKNRLKSPGCQMTKDSIMRIIEAIDLEIQKLEAEVDKSVSQHADLCKKFQLLSKYKGIGKSTARELIAFLPELGKISGKGIASLAGLAPHPKDSGNIRGYRSTAGNGRPILRRIMFMAALSAVRYNENLANFYTRKLKEGKPKMVAMTACMRKMLIQINAILKKGVIDF